LLLQRLSSRCLFGRAKTCIGEVLDLTMNVYTDPSLLDGAGAPEALPDLSVNGAAQADRCSPDQAAAAEGRNAAPEPSQPCSGPRANQRKARPTRPS